VIAWLPTVNACLNATSFLLLVTALVFIKRKNVAAHKACNLAALATSTLFLVSYLVYHAHAGSVKFTGQGWVRPAYYAILISHTVLAALVPFLAGLTLWRAFTEKFDKHRAIAKVTLPVWLYVSVTGVVIYLVLYHLYPGRIPA
jgi:uncharacterized membrane protein YozB (DUF420 family)